MNYKIAESCREARQRIKESNGRIKHIVIGWRPVGENAIAFCNREYETDAMFERDTKYLYTARCAQTVYAVHA